MARNADTHIRISEETWKELNSQKGPGDSFEDVISDLIDRNEELEERVSDLENRLAELEEGGEGNDDMPTQTDGGEPVFAD